MQIKELDHHLIDQIAAGEVIESPSGLLKEIMENAIDGQSSRVRVEVYNGGRQLKVIDNGVGIPAEELPAALKRHYTSKIHKFNDLFSLSSYGFRGEALASASSVSHLSLSSRPKGQEIGSGVESHFGEVGAVLERPMDFGTEVQIQKLFQNVPARLQFLKTDSTEIKACEKVFMSFALTYPHIEFQYLVENELKWNLKSSANANSNFESFFNIKPSYSFSDQFENYTIRWVGAPPHKTMRRSSNLFTFVQERRVEDRALISAIRDGFKGTLLPGEFPIGALWVDTDPSLVDVNVHPSKTKVKFIQGGKVYRSIVQTLQKFVSTAPWLNEVLKPESKISSASENFKNPVSKIQNLNVKPLSRPSNSKPSQITPPQFEKPAPIEKQEVLAHMSAMQQGLDFWNTPQAAKDTVSWSSLNFQSQVFKTYLIFSNSESLVFVDQHAAHERILFETFMKNFKEKKIQRQKLLIPFQFKIENEEFSNYIFDHKDELLKIGVVFKKNESGDWEITEMPAQVKENSLITAFQNWEKELLSGLGSRAFEEMTDDFFATLACHSALRAGDVVQPPEAHALLKQMDVFKESAFCPHGRPAFWTLKKSQIEKNFCRVI